MQIFQASHWPSDCGRINQVADCGDEDEDEDKDEDEDEDKDKDGDETPNYAVLLTASVERFGVSRMRDFYNKIQSKTL